MARVGRHRSDRRWQGPDGDVWASKFECDVFYGLRDHGYRVRRCDESDTIAYYTPIKEGRCLECSSDKVVQSRSYTADLYVVETPDERDIAGRYLVECKGYFPPDKRRLFVAVSKELQRSGQDIRIIFESNRRLRGSKMTPVEYIHKYAKHAVPGVWDKKTKEVTWYE